MLPGDTLEDFINATSLVISEPPPDVMLRHVTRLHIAYLVTLLTPEWQEVGTHLYGHEIFPDFVAFTTRLLEVKANMVAQGMLMPEVVMEEPMQEQEECALIPLSGSETEG